MFIGAKCGIWNYQRIKQMKSLRDCFCHSGTIHHNQQDILNIKWSLTAVQGYLCVIGQCHWYTLYKGSMTMTMTMTGLQKWRRRSIAEVRWGVRVGVISVRGWGSSRGELTTQQSVLSSNRKKRERCQQMFCRPWNNPPISLCLVLFCFLPILSLLLDVLSTTISFQKQKSDVTRDFRIF